MLSTCPRKRRWTIPKTYVSAGGGSRRACLPLTTREGFDVTRRASEYHWFSTWLCKVMHPKFHACKPSYLSQINMTLPNRHMADLHITCSPSIASIHCKCDVLFEEDSVRSLQNRTFTSKAICRVSCYCHFMVDNLRTRCKCMQHRASLNQTCISMRIQRFPQEWEE